MEREVMAVRWKVQGESLGVRFRGADGEDGRGVETLFVSVEEDMRCGTACVRQGGRTKVDERWGLPGT